MTARAQRRAFVGAALGLWLFFVVQAINVPILLDDWFELRYWRDNELGLAALWQYAHHNYLFYNPRLGEVLLAIVDGSRAIHLIVTPLIQLAVLPTVFAIAFGRWPRRTLRDLQLLLFIQVLVWLVIPVPGIIYFYRPIATNYLWAFTITLALFVPYRLALANDDARSRLWLVPVMLVLGWLAGMCNEHTGPTAMVAMAGFIYAAYRMRRLRAWMVSGMIGLYIGYPMLFFAPGQTMRYGGLATRETPTKLLADRGVSGCLAILREFLFESRLGILVVAAAIVRYLFTIHRRDQIVGPARRDLVAAGVLVAAAAAIVVTLFASPTASDRVFYASGVLLVAAFAICARFLFEEPLVRRFVVGACVLIFGYHVVRFVETGVSARAETDERLAILAAAAPGSVAVVPSYEYAERSHWHLGDDFAMYPWLRAYVAGELYDLAAVDLDRGQAHTPPLVATRTYDPPRITRSRWQVPTYRQLQSPFGRVQLAMQLAQATGLVHFTIDASLEGRKATVIDWTPNGTTFIDGEPLDNARGHFIHVRGLPTHVEASYVIGCGGVARAELVDDLIPVDERVCRGPFTAIACEPDRCWVAGWY